MAFQIVWLVKSKQLIEEQFDQRVKMAMGNALTDFNAANQTELNTDAVVSGFSNDSMSCMPRSAFEEGDQEDLENRLQGYMSCYGIDEKYSVEVFEKNCQPDKAVCCAMSTGEDSDGAVLGVSFTGRGDYMYDKMAPMIISSIAIFLLLATVCFYILGALVKQKRITANNIDFFNNTAHELKTPLTNISLALKLMSRKHPGLEDDKYAEVIRSENSRLSDQIERVLFLSQMENGEYVLEKKVLEVGEVLKRVVADMSLAVEEKQGKVRLNLPPGGAQVLGDAYHLANVFRNLIDNALKYCDKTPEIEISVREQQEHIVVSFSDNGIGVSPQDQKHIFEKFQRVNTGNVRQAKGFGIGLSYVKTVIELHKGLVQIKSELHKGSQFQLMIPNA